LADGVVPRYEHIAGLRGLLRIERPSGFAYNVEVVAAVDRHPRSAVGPTAAELVGPGAAPVAVSISVSVSVAISISVPVAVSVSIPVSVPVPGRVSVPVPGLGPAAGFAPAIVGTGKKDHSETEGQG